MIIGKLICANADKPQLAYSEWIPRGADNGVFTVEVIYVVGASVTVKVFHKNSEDTGPGTEAGTVLDTESGPGISYATIQGLKEMVRYQLEVASAGVGGAHYRFLPVTWFNTALVPTLP